jgi:hypothetical protein
MIANNKENDFEINLFSPDLSLQLWPQKSSSPQSSLQGGQAP